MNRTIDNSQDILDFRDIISRVEELESLIEETDNSNDAAMYDLQQEHNELSALLSDLKGNGGDEQWRGDWYPTTLIRDSYFVDYAEELVKDINDMPSDLPDYIVIDWEATAENLRVDYSSVEFDGVTYWYR